MFIPEFFAGILLTVFVELLLLMAYAVYKMRSVGGKNEDEDNNNQSNESGKCEGEG